MTDVYTPPPSSDFDELADEEATLGLGDRVRKLLASDGQKEPLYPRVLGLKNVHPNGWQRAVLVEGVALAGGLAALADLATAWAPLILPIAAAAVVKFHDVLAGVLPPRAAEQESGAAGEGDAARQR